MWMLHSGEFSWGWRAPTSVLSNGSLTTGYGGFRSYHNKDEKINILEGCKVTNLLWGQPAIHQGHNLHHLQPKCPSFINREKKETSALNLSKWRILRILECGYPKLWVSTPKWPNDLEHLGYSHFRTPELQKKLGTSMDNQGARRPLANSEFSLRLRPSPGVLGNVGASSDPFW